MKEKFNLLSRIFIILIKYILLIFKKYQKTWTTTIHVNESKTVDEVIDIEKKTDDSEIDVDIDITVGRKRGKRKAPGQKRTASVSNFISHNIFKRGNLFYSEINIFIFLKKLYFFLRQLPKKSEKQKILLKMIV